jgi:hypothetical protein
MGMVALLLALGLVLTGCGTESTPRAPVSSGQAQEYEATGTVLQKVTGRPELCLGAIALSYPPQCGGPVVVGWDWDAIEGEESANGVRWVEAAVRGRYDAAGKAFTLTAPPTRPRPRPAGAPSREPDFSPACDTPTGDPSVTTASWGEGVTHHRELVAIWVSDPSGPWDGPFVASFVVRPGAAAEVTALVRGQFGGMLCVVERDQPTMQELRSIQDRVPEVLDDIMSVSSDHRRGVVRAEVIVADEEARRRVDEAFGPGKVVLTGALTPVS